MSEQAVWVFTGERAGFPSGVFSTQEVAEKWILSHALSGTLTMYRLNFGAYDWAVDKGHFKPSKPEHYTPDFIAKFSGGDTHVHYESGKRG